MSGERQGTQPGHSLDDVPDDQRYCNECGDEIRSPDDVGDFWWETDPGPQGTATILCRDCA